MGIKDLAIFAALISLSITEQVCKGLYLGTKKDIYDIMRDGVWSNLWDPKMLKEPRKIIRRDAEYLYAKHTRGEIEVRFRPWSPPSCQIESNYLIRKPLLESDRILLSTW